MLFKCTHAELDAALAATCRMSLVRLTVHQAGCEILTSSQRLLLTLSPRGPALELGFRGPWRVGKGKLIKKLIAKQFDPVVPRLRIRLRRAG